MAVDNSKLQSEISQRCYDYSKKYDDLFYKFKRELLSQMMSVLKYYQKNEKIERLEDFLNEYMVVFKGIAKYKSLLNNFSDAAHFIEDNNALDNMFKDAQDKNANVNFLSVFTDMRYEILNILDHNIEITNNVMDQVRRKFNEFNEIIREENKKMISQFKSIISFAKINDTNHIDVIKNMPANEAVEYLKFTLNNSSIDDANKLIEDLMQSDISDEIRRFLENKKDENKFKL